MEKSRQKMNVWIKMLVTATKSSSSCLVSLSLCCSPHSLLFLFFISLHCNYASVAMALFSELYLFSPVTLLALHLGCDELHVGCAVQALVDADSGHTYMRVFFNFPI